MVTIVVLSNAHTFLLSKQLITNLFFGTAASQYQSTQIPAIIARIPARSCNMCFLCLVSVLLQFASKFRPTTYLPSPSHLAQTYEARLSITVSYNLERLAQDCLAVVDLAFPYVGV